MILQHIGGVFQPTPTEIASTIKLKYMHDEKDANKDNSLTTKYLQ